MAVDRQDQRFLEAMRAAEPRLFALTGGPETEEWRASAHMLLSSALQGFEDLVREESREEREADEALAALHAAREGVDRAFALLLRALRIGLDQRRMSFGFDDEQMTGLAWFLDRYQSGTFSTLNADEAIQTLELAVQRFAQGFVPEQHWEEVSQQVNAALAQARQAREDAAREGAEAVEAYGRLVEGRAIARVCYLTARDLVSAALRFDGTHDQLATIMPPIADILVSDYRA